MMPSISLNGGVVQDPELRFSASGKAILKLRVVVRDRKRDSATGNWTDGAPWFFTVTAFGHTAERAADTIEKGHQVLVIGRLTVDQWKDKDDNERTELNIVADELGVSTRWTQWKASEVDRQSTAGEENQDSAWSTKGGSEPPF